MVGVVRFSPEREDVASASKAVLDTSVLLPMPLCDTLLRVAEQGLYRPVWSDDILDELVRNLTEWAGATAADKRVAAMRTVFPDACATDYQHLSEMMTNHPKDRHVLAA